MSNSSQVPRASGKPNAMFSSRSNEPGNQFEISVLKFADPSNLRRSLLEGNKDHLLSQARSELVRQERQVGSLIIASVSFSNKLVLKDWNYRTHNTDILNLEESKFDCKKN